mgnify:CR=1 FL=1
MSNTNESAFPMSWENPLTGKATINSGITLRDYFAAQALTGAQIWDAVLNGKETTQFSGNVDKLGEVAYAVADAMLKARKA